MKPLKKTGGEKSKNREKFRMLWPGQGAGFQGKHQGKRQTALGRLHRSALENRLHATMESWNAAEPESDQAGKKCLPGRQQNRTGRTAHAVLACLQSGRQRLLEGCGRGEIHNVSGEHGR